MKTEKIKKLIEKLEKKMGEFGDSSMYVIDRPDWEQFKQDLNSILEDTEKKLHDTKLEEEFNKKINDIKQKIDNIRDLTLDLKSKVEYKHLGSVEHFKFILSECKEIDKIFKEEE